MTRPVIALAALLISMPAVAEAATAYETFLTRLDQKLDRLAQGGWTSRDVDEVRREVSARPSADPRAYVAFTGVLDRLVVRLESGGVVSNEVKVLKLVASIAPKSQTGRRGQYEAYTKMLANACERLSSGGFVSREVELVQILASAAPSKTVGGGGYNSAYKAWSNDLARAERTLSRGGLVSNERKVLEIFRGLQPVDGGGQPSMGSGNPNMGSGKPTIPDRPNMGTGEPDMGTGEPDMGSGEPDMGSGAPDMGSGEGNEFCGRRYRVEEKFDRTGRRGPKAIALRTRRGELLDIHPGDCEVAWLAGNVKSVLRLGRRSMAVLQRDGTLLLVTGDNGVHRLGRRVDRIESDGRRSLTMYGRRGRRRVELERRRAGGATMPVTIDGRRRDIPRLYDPVVRPIERRR